MQTGPDNERKCHQLCLQAVAGKAGTKRERVSWNMPGQFALAAINNSSFPRQAGVEAECTKQSPEQRRKIHLPEQAALN